MRKVLASSVLAKKRNLKNIGAERVPRRVLRVDLARSLNAARNKSSNGFAL
jgi:hypothetical protein